MGLALVREADIRIEVSPGVSGEVPRSVRLVQSCDLHPGQSAKLLHLTRTMGSAAEVVVITSWCDDEGSHELPTRLPLT